MRAWPLCSSKPWRLASPENAGGADQLSLAEWWVDETFQSEEWSVDSTDTVRLQGTEVWPVPSCTNFLSLPHDSWPCLKTRMKKCWCSLSNQSQMKPLVSSWHHFNSAWPHPLGRIWKEGRILLISQFFGAPGEIHYFKNQIAAKSNHVRWQSA